MNEGIFYTLAEVAIALAGFSGVVAAFHLHGAQKWSPMELRVLWYLILDSFCVMFFSFLPVVLALANWPHDILWAGSSILLSLWFIGGNLLTFGGNQRNKERKNRTAQLQVPVIMPLLNRIFIIGLGMAALLWLNAANIVPRGQAIYTLGLIVLLAFAALEFLFFIGLSSKGNSKS